MLGNIRAWKLSFTSNRVRVWVVIRSVELYNLVKTEFQFTLSYDSVAYDLTKLDCRGRKQKRKTTLLVPQSQRMRTSIATDIFLCFCSRLRWSSFPLIARDGVISGVAQKTKSKRSDLCVSDSNTLMGLLTSPIFDFTSSEPLLRVRYKSIGNY